MKASFDGARINLARSYNTLASEVGWLKEDMTESELRYRIQEIHSAMDSMRSNIGGLLCMYDDDIEGDCTMLADDVRLAPWFCE